MFCANCGAKLAKGSKFCTACGCKVGEVLQGGSEEIPVTSTQGMNVSQIEKKVMIRLSFILGYVMSVVLFVAAWFESPMVEWFSSEEFSFSFLDIVSAAFNTGRFFEKANISLGGLLAEIPFYVRAGAVLLGLLYFVSIAWLLIATVRIIVSKPILRSQAGAVVTSLLMAFLSLLLVKGFQNYVDESIGYGLSVGAEILEITWQFKCMIALLVVILVAIIVVSAKRNGLSIILHNPTARTVCELKRNFTFGKREKIIVGIICGVVVIGMVASAINNSIKHSDGLTAEEIRQDGYNELSYTKDAYTLTDKLQGWESRIDFHIDSADGVYTLWSLNAYDDGLDMGEYETQSFCGSMYACASKNVDITFYVLYPDGTIYASCPIDDWDNDGSYTSGITGFSSCTGGTYDENGNQLFTGNLFGEYRIIMVADDVEDVDIVFAYDKGSTSDSGYYYYRMYYPGEY
uniref:hypothetical protein n=1 Tax=Acetatifactor sp. TaxID=1872090 RepID=UPI0040564E85